MTTIPRTAYIPAVTDTDRVLAAMLTENTGSHFLDSGSAYGRNHERNAGREVEEFVASPAVSFDGWERDGDELDDCYPILSVFHFLRDRLEYDPRMDRSFNLWVALRDEPDDPWLEEAEAFAEAWHDDDRWGDGVSGRNSYNGESYLSQVIQWTEFTRDMQRYAILQIHGGCDVRGGYTKPRVFRMDPYALHYEDINAGCSFDPGPVICEQLALAGDAMPLHANGECPLPRYGIDFRTGEVSIYLSDSGEELYERDEGFADYWPRWDSEERQAVCKGCGSPIVGDLNEFSG